MSIQIELEPAGKACNYVPLAVLGYCLTRSQFLQPIWDEVRLAGKTVKHTPQEKVQDILLAILAGCRSLAHVNTKLRPELMLAAAWNRQAIAEQSNLSRQLDSFDEQQVEQLRQANTKLLQQHSQLLQHNWQKLVMLDIDSTILLASKKAEKSKLGFTGSARRGSCRHVLRFTLAGYHESLLSLVYPGNRHGYEYGRSAFKKLLTIWPQLSTQATQVVIRTDAGLGTDKLMAYLLWQKFHLLMKGFSGRRTAAWVKQLPETSWLADETTARWMARAPKQLRLGRHTDSYLLRYLDTKANFAHATLHTTLPLADFALWNLYDQRATTEIEIRADKSGLLLHLRRKHSFTAISAWVILTDIAHNLLAWLQGWMLHGTRFAAFGPKRIVNELFCMPGCVHMDENGRLQKVTLWPSHPYASDMLLCLQNLLKSFDLL